MSDTTLFIVVAICFAIWLLMWIIPAGITLYKWYRHQKSMEDVDNYVIPKDYDAVGREVKRINNDYESGSLQQQQANEAREGKLSAVREVVAEVRYQGYLRGEQDESNSVKFGVGITANPHQPQSGAAKQWVRGYCMARGVLDIKPYYDEA